MFPRIIHQIWIGTTNPAPLSLMDSWRRAHVVDGFEYILWTEEELLRRGASGGAGEEDGAFIQELSEQMRWSPSLAGRADILRWEILHHYGGVYSDADSECVESCLAILEHAEKMGKDMVCAYENEAVRGAGCFPEYEDIPRHSPLISNGFIAVKKGHPVMRAAIDTLLRMPRDALSLTPPWRATGPGLLTRLTVAMKPSVRDRMVILPSYTFFPRHPSGQAYLGHGKIYAHQYWASTTQLYAHLATQRDDDRGDAETPSSAAPLLHLLPHRSSGVSLLVCSHNTPAKFLRPCIDSILHQQGNFEIEVVWVDDGSDTLHATLLKKMLADLERTSRGIRVRVVTSPENRGVAWSLRVGLEMCSNERVARMDSDDIMVLDRLAKQMAWMDEHHEAVVVGGQVLMFKDADPVKQRTTRHPATLTTDTYDSSIQAGLLENPYWVMNHPTLMFVKDAVLKVGSYDPEMDGVEDYDLEMRLMQTFGSLHNMPDVLVLYRIHSDQVTMRPERVHLTSKLRSIRHRLRR
jgi:GT2 family glycosyltransferase